MQNILKEGKTIKSALDYAKTKARSEAVNGVAVIDDETVFGWVVEYYESNQVEVVVKTAPVENESDDDGEDAPKPKKAITKHIVSDKKANVQTSIFDFAE